MLHWLRKRFSRRSASASLSERTPLEVEGLAERLLPSASPLLVRVEAIERPDAEARLTLPLTSDRLSSPRSGRALLALEVAPIEGSGLKLRDFSVFNSSNRRVAGGASPQGEGLERLIFLKPENYTIAVRGRDGSTGAFQVAVRLVGDVDGDRDVDQRDLRTIALAAARSRSGRAAALAADSSLDTNRDGKISRSDVLLAQRNLNAAAGTINFAAVNHTGVYSASDIYFAVYGQDTSGAWWYFDASGQQHSTIGLTAVPTFSLAQIPGGLNLSSASTIHGRFLIGAGAAPVAPIVNPQGAVAAANPGNPSDPNNSIYGDFIEYTITSAAMNGGQPNLNIDTSQVDAFGLPIVLQTNPADPNSPTGVGVVPSRQAVFDAFRAAVAGTPFEACVSTPAVGPHGPYRVLSPQDVLQLNPAAALSSWFNATIDAFFQQVQANPITLNFNNGAYTGTVTQVNTEGHAYTVMQFTGGGGTVNFYYPFFTSNTPAGYTPHYAAAPPPSWIVQAGKQNVSPSEMVFANNGVFADNTGQYPQGGPLSQLLGNLENQIVSALSRGVALLPTSQWTNLGAFYPTGGVWNQYAQFWHRPSISIGGKAYGFPFDDQGNNSSDLSVNSPTHATFTLGAWS